MPESIDYKRLSKHGGSLRVSIPVQIRKSLNLRVGDYFRISLSGDKIILEKASPSFTERKVK